MLDLAGIFLLIGSLVGAVKGRELPLWVPQIIVLSALTLLILQAVWRRSRFAPIHTSAVWAALTWIAGKAMELSWGKGVLTQISVWMLLLITPLIVILHQRVHKRFNPAAGKKLELTRTEISPFKEWWLSRKKGVTPKSQAIELIVFDLGEEINFQNK